MLANFSFIFIMEIIGTVAFAISGALVGLEKKMDIFGVTVLGVTTAIGGGIIRDLVLGHTPPAAFVNSIYFIVSASVSLLTFLPPVRKLWKRGGEINMGLLRQCDSIGLSAFTVIGMQAAGSYASHATMFLMVFIGVITGVGGGIIRDILANDVPFIFVKNFYASASIIGAVSAAMLWDIFGETVSMAIGFAMVFILRFLAAKYHWELPKA